MKLALLAIAPLTFALATMTGCSLSEEPTNEPEGAETTHANTNGTTEPTNDPTNGDKEAKLPAVSTDSITPAMKCQQWEVIDGRRICVR